MASNTVSSRKKSAWAESINGGRKGASYFLALGNILQAKPADYYESRNMDLAKQKAVIQEWEGWMTTFRSSEHKVLVDLGRMSHNQAAAATEYLINKELVGRKLDMMATSREQLRDNEVEMTQLLKAVPFPVIHGSTRASSIGEKEATSFDTEVMQTRDKNANDHPEKLEDSNFPDGESSIQVASMPLLSSLSNTRSATSLSFKKRKRSTADGYLQSTTIKNDKDLDMGSRRQRFAVMNESMFWKLRSGRTVEEILYLASLKQEANFKMRSYTIDFGCERTKSLFDKDEWEEMKELDDFQLPKLLESTEKYLRDVRTALVEEQHATSVPIPEEDRYSCELVLRSVLSWTQLYVSKPCPFGNKDLSESFWCREAWPIMKGLLSDVDGLTMIDGEKAGLESGKRKNNGRKVDPELPTARKKIGRKLDLVARDTTNRRDWLIVESLKEWDEVSTKYLRELDVSLFKDLHLIATHRLQELPSTEFRSEARFLSVYSGGRGFKTMEMRGCPFSPYIMLVHLYHSHMLPSTATTWKQQAQGLAHLLQVRSCATKTIKMYEALLSKDTGSNKEDESDGEWLYSSSSNHVFDETLGSSPITGDNLFE